MKRKTYNLIIVLLILILGIGLFIIYQLMQREDVAGSSAHIAEDASEWDDGIENEEEKVTGRILVPGYSGASIKEGEKVLSLRIGNPKENTCYLKATLQLEDGTVLYESGLIEPGKGYETIELYDSLEAGEYNAMVHYQGYSMDESKETLNSCDSAFVLKVTK